jgi:hypothetical protein
LRGARSGARMSDARLLSRHTPKTPAPVASGTLAPSLWAASGRSST